MVYFSRSCKVVSINVSLSHSSISSGFLYSYWEVLLSNVCSFISNLSFTQLLFISSLPSTMTDLFHISLSSPQGIAFFFRAQYHGLSSSHHIQDSEIRIEEEIKKKKAKRMFQLSLQIPGSYYIILLFILSSSEFIYGRLTSLILILDDRESNKNQIFYSCRKRT